MHTFQKTQRDFLAHLRNPEQNPAPLGLEDRRVKVYRDLIYNNVEGFIRGGFPILRSILSDDHWHSLVREFLDQHQSSSPYFLDIGEEFLTYLQSSRVSRAGDPAFMLELAHYEWVELALDISQEVWPVCDQGDLLSNKPVVSPLVWCLSYQYPVHMIGPSFQPEQAPDQPTFLVVYRNSSDDVKFMASNAVTHRLIQLLQDEITANGESALLQIAVELQAQDVSAIVAMGGDILTKLHKSGIICGTQA